jgi:hypothetical protein
MAAEITEPRYGRTNVGGMRQTFDLLQIYGWQNWWECKFYWSSYCYIFPDTAKHVACLFVGHKRVAGNHWCQRCCMNLER